MTKLSPRERREEAIRELTRRFLVGIGEAYPPGTVRIGRNDFKLLYTYVGELRELGPRNQKWLRGVRDWEETITVASKGFCDDNGFSYLNPPEYKDCTPSLREEYDHWFSWAVLQGATYAGFGA